MFADMLPPPTFCLDWYLLPWPASVIVPLALSAALITFFLYMARRVRIGWKFLLLALCLFLFVLADCIVYGTLVGSRRPQPPPRHVSPESSDAPKD
jgi:hypothetical protein